MIAAANKQNAIFCIIRGTRLHRARVLPTVPIMSTTSRLHRFRAASVAERYRTAAAVRSRACLSIAAQSSKARDGENLALRSLFTILSTVHICYKNTTLFVLSRLFPCRQPRAPLSFPNSTFAVLRLLFCVVPSYWRISKC